MTDSTAYSSLFALVEGHLSKVNLRDNQENGNNSINVSPFNTLHNGGVSDTSPIPLQPCTKLPSFGIGMGDSSIRNVLAEQVANMLKAKEKKQEEEEKIKLEEEMRKLKIKEEKSMTIDLTKAIQTPYRPELFPYSKKEVLSNSSSCESLFMMNLNDSESEPLKVIASLPLLPCNKDMSYILKQKIRKKGSLVGKTLSYREKTIAAPYLKPIFKAGILPFDFSTPSPCDIIKENLRKPSMSCRFVFNLEEFINENKE